MMKPKFILSKSKVLEQYEKVKEVSDVVSYSSKTNPLVSGILEEKTDSMFSIHSVHELKNIKDKSRILFLAQGWDEEELKNLIFEGVRFFVVDNIKDLELLKEYLGRNFIPRVSVFLRLKLKEHTLKTEKYFVFGFSSDFINEEIGKLKEFAGIEKVGIHFHRKTQNISEWELKREIEGSIKESVLKELDFIVLGGGLPSVYANTNVKIFNGIFEKIKEFREWANNFGIKVISEPGRFIAAPSVKLVSHVKTVYDRNLVVDASVYNTDLDALIVPVKLLVEGEVEKGLGDPYVIKGITPCSMDLFRYRVYFEEEPKVGDEIVFLNAGAYNFLSDFCDLERVETEVVD